MALGIRCRRHTCKIVLFTSLVWCILDLLVLVSFSDCSNGMGWGCEGGSRGKHGSLKFAHQLQEDNAVGGVSVYPGHLLREWSLAPVVSPIPGSPGEMGKAVVVPKEREEEKKEKFKINQFNLVASEMISLNRSLQDVRLAACKTKDYAVKLPTTSIVIVFHNEAWTTLLRTIHSIINRSPKALVEEIILVDDASEHAHLGKELEDYVATLSLPVKVLRTGKRSGLIRARLLGAEQVKGSVITFLDAHCECTEGWLEPLLAEIAKNRKAVVCPIIDVISDENFEYVTASDMTWGGFNWKLNFRWYRVPQREMDRRNGDRSQPLRTPAMAGGLFSIDKDYFYEVGSYDRGMDIWGGENLEMSFRVWQCGGVLEIIPCSHVGHVFRDKSPYTFPGGVAKIVNKNAARVAEVWMDEWRDFYYSMNPGTVWTCGGELLIATCSHVGHVFRKSTPYSFPGGTSKIVNHNNARLAEVWLDEWKDFYFSINPGARTVEIGDLTERRSLRKDLQCKSFRWYLENIYPESQMPLDYFYLGEMKNEATHNCLDTMGRKSGEALGLSYCHGLGGNQVFAYTKRQQIMSDDNCLDSASAKGPVKLVRCHGMGGNQAWNYNEEDRSIRHMNTNRCLATQNHDPSNPVLAECTGGPNQQWTMESKFKWQAKS
ncbi:hypothetical protein TCAL_09989 [Tigriopus californicus]|uniref:Polypeptide N-acetylgalactosaminyltransferase n=1 Tax=Tigriopus californicus TaxID=6832 RepID=A0A553PND4_TIGCA|nr:hypothetical protein TCAL_09989 [Tigriopus californicus]